MESISSRYQEPMSAEFYDASFYRACVDLEIIQYAAKDEELALYPFGIFFVVKEEGWEGTWKAFEEAFSNDETYRVKRLNETRFRIERRDDTKVSEPFSCSILATENAELLFLDDFKNIKDNEVLITEQLKPCDGIGIWIQREISNFVERSNKDLLKDYDEKRELEKVENVELVIDYELDYDFPKS